MTRDQALLIASNHHIPLDRDFHALDHDTVNRIIEAARQAKYREPKGANGSRARYFHARLQRASRRAS